MTDIVLADGAAHAQPQALRFVDAPARVDLLPKEIHDEEQVASTRRLALLGIVGSVVVVAAAFVGVGLIMAGSAQRLASAQSQTAALQQELNNLAPARDMQERAMTFKSVDGVIGGAGATGTDIDWQPLVSKFLTGLPAGAAITTLTITVDSPQEQTPPMSGLFIAPQIGEIAAQVVGPDPVALTNWLDQLKSDPTFSEVLNLGTSGGTEGWQMSVTVSIAPELTAVPTPTPTPEVTPMPTEAGQ
ncbi:MAG: hypothetical protein J7484_14515 [Microbacterium sp.]|nr:hypothetical protein [Microbacterium sp.]